MADSTSTDLPVASGATPEEAAAFRLDPHLIRLMWDEPFFSRILRQVTKVRTDAIPTAGVLAREGDIKMWWNPEFMAGLNDSQVKGLLKHECYHLIFNHTTTRRHEPHLVWNYATDLAINSIIPLSELPEGGLIAGQAFTPLTDEQREQMDPQRIADYELLSATIEEMPVGKSSEWYFSKLMNDPDVKDALDRADGAGQDGEGEGNGPLIPGTTDDHGGWGEMSEEERELVKGKVKEILKDAATECDKSGAWGTVDAKMRKKIRQMLQGEIPWQSILKRFVGTTRRSTRTSSIRRLNRKYPGVHPGAKKNYTSSIAVYIDQSGSVSNAELELLFGELTSLAKHTEFILFNFDNSVDEESERQWKRGRTPGIERTRAGGTNFQAVTDHAEKNSKRFDGYIICSDGECSKPSPSRLKRCWVITPDRKLYFDPDRRDIVVQMKGKNKG